MNKSEKFLYVLAGTGVGAMLGMLFAPRRGSELRNTIASQAKRGADLVNEKVEEGRKYVQEKGGPGGTVRNIVDRGKQQFNESVDNVRNRFNEAVETGKQEYTEKRGEGAL